MNDSEILQVILAELKELKQGQAKLEQGQAKLEQGQAKLEQGQASLKQELSDVKALASKTAVIVENDIATNIALLQEDNLEIVRKLKRLEKLPQMVSELQDDVSMIKEVVSMHSQDIKQLKAQ